MLVEQADSKLYAVISRLFHEMIGEIEHLALTQSSLNYSSPVRKAVKECIF